MVNINSVENEVLVSLLDGEELYGAVNSFNAKRPAFFLQQKQAAGPPISREIKFEKTKMISFFHKRDEMSKPSFPPTASLVTVRFLDSEVIQGITQNYGGRRLGIFLVPIAEEEIERIYVPVSAIQDVVSVRRLGEMMTEKEVLTREMIKGAIQKQARSSEEPIGQTLVERQIVPNEQIVQGMTLQNQHTPHRIGQILMVQGFIEQAQVNEALDAQKRQSGKKLGEILVQMGYATHKMIGIALAIQYGIPFMNLRGQVIDSDLQALVPEAVARQWHIVPLHFRYRILTIAVADPTDRTMRDALQRKTGLAVNLVASTPQDISQTSLRLYGRQETVVERTEYVHQLA